MKPIRQFPPVLTREAYKNAEAWLHIRVLVLLADNFVDLTTNQIGDYTTPQLAEKCGMDKSEIIKSIHYLRENNYIVSILDNEYINPIYYYQCGHEELKKMKTFIVDEWEHMIDGSLYKKPCYKPVNKGRISFKNVPVPY
jgi:hypothetical protein